MPEVNLTNSASVEGTYNLVPTSFQSLAVTTLLVEGLSIVLTQDKPVWVNGDLTYTATVTNTASQPYENPVITDALDTTIMSLVENSVQVGGVDAAYTYDAVTGILKVTLGTIPVGGSAAVTFRVQKN